MNYSPNEFKGKYFSEIFSEVLESNKTLNGANGIRVIDNIKTETIITSLQGEIPLQPYSDDPSTPSDSLSFGDAIVKPIKTMAHFRYSPEDFRFSRFSDSIPAGALNVTSNELEQEILTYSIPKVGLSLEKAFWQGVTSASKISIAGSGNTSSASIKSKVASLTTGSTDGVFVVLSQDPSVIKVSGTVLTVSNLDTEFNKVFAAIPSALIGNDDTKIYAPKSVKQLILMANNAQAYRDKFTVAGDNYSYLGVKIEFVPIPENTMTAGKDSDYILATDLSSDHGSFRTGLVNNEGEKRFMKAVMSLDAAICVPTQKVLYA